MRNRVAVAGLGIVAGLIALGILAFLVLQAKSSQSAPVPEGYGMEAIAAFTFLNQVAYSTPDPSVLLKAARERAVAVAGLRDFTPKAVSLEVDSQILRELGALYQGRRKDADPTAIVNAYISGMVDSISLSHAEYWPSGYMPLPEMHIGISTVSDPLGRRVWEVRPNSVAASAGILPADVITEMNGTLIAELARANPTDPLRLTIERNGQSLEITVPYLVAGPSVFLGKRLSSDVVYLRLSSLNLDERPFGPINETAFAIATNSAGIILDLRGNPGGAFGNAGAVAAKLNVNGRLALLKDRSGREVQIDIQKSPTPLANRKLVVLVNSETRSAGEVLAFILREAGGATILGEQTSGCVMGARFVDLEGGTMEVPSDLVLVGPSGIVLEGVGVTPDVSIEFDFDALKRGEDNVIARAQQILSSGGP